MDPCSAYADSNLVRVVVSRVGVMAEVMLAPDEGEVLISTEKFAWAVVIPLIPVVTGTLSTVPVAVIEVVEVCVTGGACVGVGNVYVALCEFTVIVKVEPYVAPVVSSVVIAPPG